MISLCIRKFAHMEGGLSFASWDLGVQAHLGQLLAFALRDEEANDAQRQMMLQNPRHSALGQELRGCAPTLAGLNGRWTPDPALADKIAACANEMMK